MTQPIRADTATSTGRTNRPATAAIAVAANHAQNVGRSQVGQEPTR